MEISCEGGITAIAVLNITLGVPRMDRLPVSAYRLARPGHELVRLGVFERPPAPSFLFYACGNGHRGISRGCRVSATRPSACPLSFGVLRCRFFVCCSFFVVPIIASIGTYDIRSLSAEGLARLVLFAYYIGIAWCCSSFLFVVFSRADWRATFANGLLAYVCCQLIGGFCSLTPTRLS